MTTTLQKDLLRALNDEAFQDVTLIGTDHVDVPASKIILSLRSTVFQKMFLGNFQEKNQDRVPLDYPSLVLQVLVKYCYSDELDIDLLLRDSSTDKHTHLNDETAVLAIQLRSAATYFDLPELKSRISQYIGEKILYEDNVGCICAVFNELLIRGEEDEILWTMLMPVLNSNLEKCLFPKLTGNAGIASCSLSLFCIFVQPTVDSFLAVKAVQKWCSLHVFNQSEAPNELRTIADSLDLASIEPGNLAKIKPCTLFPMERLYHAFVQNSPESSSKVDTEQNSGPFKPTPSYVQVKGAGIDSVNGTYILTTASSNDGVLKRSRYTKVGKYGDENAKFCVVDFERSWKILVYIKAATPFVLYQSSNTSHPEKVPFATWYCRDGKAPAPYAVATSSAPVMFNIGSVEDKESM